MYPWISSIASVRSIRGRRALAGAPAAAGDPFGYATPDGTARVVYRGSDNHIRELFLPVGSGWATGDLSAAEFVKSDGLPLMSKS